MKTKELKRNKGITLIALVITIIILLILAGVTITTLTGENGILTRASEANEQTEKKGLREEIELAVGSNNIGDQVDGSGNLEEELNRINGATVSKVAEDAYYVERDGNGYTVYEDGTIEEGKVDVWDGATIEKPEVDENNNWHIYTTGQMKFFANYCNNTLTEEEKTEANMPEITETTTVYLENNLDMGARQEDGVLTTVAETQWTPVDMSYGTFEGNNHSISGIYVSETLNTAGLFGVSDTINNLTIKNSYIESTGQMVGGITGMSGTTITNCHNVNTVVISSNLVVGGIVGVVGDIIKDCTNTGNITASGCVGGIAGNGFIFGFTIENCVNSGEVVGTSAVGVGGIAGYTTSSTSINNSYNTGTINGKNSYVGGIVGHPAKNLIISNCYNTGEVTGETQRIGGIAGSLSNDASITDSYNLGKITGKAERIGGIVGELLPNSTITNSYNEGKVTGVAEETTNVGGIAGIIFGTIENSYNKGQIEGQEQVGGIAGQIGMDYEVNIRNCYNEGEIIGQDSSIGGIVGWTSVTGTSGTIENNYNKGTVRGVTGVGGIIGRNAETFVVTKCYNKGTVEGTTNVGSVIGEQLNGNDNLSKLYYLSTLNLGGVNGQDVADKVIGVSDDINSYENFLTWIESK